MIKPTDPTFPHANPNYDGNWEKEPQRAGMSLRTHLAAEAMKGVLSNPVMVGTHRDATVDWIASVAVRAADALISALNTPPTSP